MEDPACPGVPLGLGCGEGSAPLVTKGVTQAWRALNTPMMERIGMAVNIPIHQLGSIALVRVIQSHGLMELTVPKRLLYKVTLPTFANSHSLTHTHMTSVEMCPISWPTDY